MLATENNLTKEQEYIFCLLYSFTHQNVENLPVISAGIPFTLINVHDYSKLRERTE